MTSSHECRYALWNHTSQQMLVPIAWRCTPKSKAYVTVMAPKVLPGDTCVAEVSEQGIRLQINEAQMQAIRMWTSELPSEVMCPTACETGIIEHRGLYTIIGGDMRAITQHPLPGWRVRVRLTAHVTKIGPIHKTVLRVSDVLCADVAAV